MNNIICYNATCYSINNLWVCCCFWILFLIILYELLDLCGKLIIAVVKGCCACKRKVLFMPLLSAQENPSSLDLVVFFWGVAVQCSTGLRHVSMLQCCRLL